MRIVKETERYLKTPYSIFNMPDLKQREKTLLAYIYGFGENGCWQSNRTLARVFFCNPRTIQRSLRSLGKYLSVKCPKGHYRTMWAKDHPDVKAGMQKWMKDQAERQDNSRQKQSIVVRQFCRTTHDKTVVLPHDKTVALLRTLGLSKKLAPPTPLPAYGQASAVLHDRKSQARSTIRETLDGFGQRRRPWDKMPAKEFANRRNKQLDALLVSA